MIKSLDDSKVWDNMQVTDELLDEIQAKYGPYKTITDENINEFLDELFIRTKKEMLGNKGKSIQALNGVFGMYFSLIEAYDVNTFLEVNITICITVCVFADIKIQGQVKAA